MQAIAQTNSKDFPKMLALSNGTIEKRRTKRRFEVVAVTDNLNDEKKDEVEIDTNGFCVMCEEHNINIWNHMIDLHRNNALALQPCYNICFFQDTRIMAPPGVAINDELEKCEPCGGVFYKHRRLNHRCGHIDLLINEGNGNKYCLMCQCRVPDIAVHWLDVHNINRSYDLDNLDNTLTLLPKHTNLNNAELTVSFNPCGFNCCLRFRYKNRVYRPCQANNLQ